MKAHATASESTQRQANLLGRIFRGARATRDASLSDKGSSAPSARRGLIVLAVLVAMFTLIPLANAQAETTMNFEIAATEAGASGRIDTVVLDFSDFSETLIECEGPPPGSGSCQATGEGELGAASIEATPAAESEFAEWTETGPFSPGCAGEPATCSEAKLPAGEEGTLTAVFAPEPVTPTETTMNFEIAATEAGASGRIDTVVLDFSDFSETLIECEGPPPGSGSCQATGEGELGAASIEATPAAESEFAEWTETGPFSPGCAGEPATCSEAKLPAGEEGTLTAVFAPEPVTPTETTMNFEIAATEAGASGRIDTVVLDFSDFSETLIECEGPPPGSGSCQATGEGELGAASIEATPAAESEFAEWTETGPFSPGCAGEPATCSEAKLPAGEEGTLTAVFAPEPVTPTETTMNFEIAATEAGASGRIDTVVLDFSDFSETLIECEGPPPGSGSCQATGEGELGAASIEATPAAESEFAEWTETGPFSPGCAGEPATCSEAKLPAGEEGTLTAVFAPEPVTPTETTMNFEIAATEAGASGRIDTVVLDFSDFSETLIECEGPPPGSGSCQATGEGELGAASIEATPAAESEFAEWTETGPFSPGCAGEPATCSEAKLPAGEEGTLTAVFAPEPVTPTETTMNFEIAATEAGASGRIDTVVLDFSDFSETLIECEGPPPGSGSCQATGEGELGAASIEATPAAESEFAEWTETGPFSPGCAGEPATCSEAKLPAGEEGTLTAVFAPEPVTPTETTMNFEIAATEAGASGRIDTVVLDFSDFSETLIECEGPPPGSGSCQATGEGELGAASIEATPAAESEFAEWTETGPFSPGCAGEPATCSEAKLPAGEEGTLTAVFAPEPVTPTETTMNFEIAATEAGASGRIDTVVLDFSDFSETLIECEGPPPGSGSCQATGEGELGAASIEATPAAESEFAEWTETGPFSPGCAGEPATCSEAKLPAGEEGTLTAVFAPEPVTPTETTMNFEIAATEAGASGRIDTVVLDFSDFSETLIECEGPPPGSGSCQATGEGELGAASIEATPAAESEFAEWTETGPFSPGCAGEPATCSEAKLPAGEEGTLTAVFAPEPVTPTETTMNFEIAATEAGASGRIDTVVLDFSDFSETLIECEGPPPGSGSCQATGEGELGAASIEATPAAESEFAEWTETGPFSPGCAGEPATCSEAKLPAGEEGTLTAVFAPEPVTPTETTMNFEIAATEAGASGRIDTVVLDFSDFSETLIECEGPPPGSGSCQATGEGELGAASIEATPAAESEFAEWTETGPFSPGCAGEPATCSEAKLPAGEEGTLTAVFAPEPVTPTETTMNFEIAATEAGASGRIDTVVLDFSDFSETLIECEGPPPGSGSCQATGEGELGAASIEATPAAESEFAEWTETGPFSPGCAGEPATCSEAKLPAGEEGTLTAVFAPEPVTPTETTMNFEIAATEAGASGRIDTVVLDFSDFSETLIECEGPPPGSGSCQATGEGELGAASIEATPAAESEFAEWTETGPFSPGCAGEPATCSEAKLPAGEEGTLTAVFAPEPVTPTETTMNFEIAATEAGASGRIDTVVLDFSDFSETLIECEGPPPGSGSCQATGEGELGAASIEATPAAESEFAEWTETGPFSPGCAGEPATCSEAKLPAGEEGTLTAVFAPEPVTPTETTMNFEIAATEAGASGRIDTVVLDFSDFSETLIECEGPPPGSGSCQATGEGELGAASIEATPAAESEFAEWTETGPFSPGCAGEPATCSEAKLPAGEEGTLTAVFAPEAGKSLTINTTAGTGNGQVNCQVVGGSLDSPCESSYPEETELELIAEAATGSTFVAFENGTNDASSCSTSPCTITLNEDSALDANFAQEAPTVTNDAPGTITASSIVMKGHVNNNGAAAGSTCKFVIAKKATPGTPVAEPACSPNPVTGGTSTAVEATATGLESSTEYVYRVVATNSGGTTTGTPDREATTAAPSAPTVTNDAPGTITASSIVMKGHVNNNTASGGSTCKFVIAKKATPGTPVAEPACSPNPVTGGTSTAVEATATGLESSTEYVYRVVATNSGGTTTGTPDREATTLAVAPTVTNDAPGTITASSIVMKGHVNNNGAAAGSTCKFVIAKKATPGTPVAEPACSPNPVTGGTSTAVEATATGLESSTEYVYRVVATNSGGTTTGTPDREATTLAVAPTVTNDAPGTITASSIVMKGHVNNNGAAAGSTCKFVIAKKATPGTPVAEPACSPNPVTGGTSTAVEATATGLESSTEYVYRVVATNSGGTTTGTPDREATTLANEHSLTINQGGSGSGSVQCDTGSGPEACQSSYANGETLTAIATADAGSEFVEWAGECDTVVGNECEVTLDADKTIEAVFDLAPRTLSVSKAGSGGGAVTSIPAGIDCGATCSHAYEYGTLVRLSESPDSISDFGGWSGCDEVVAGECLVAMTAAREVTATFTARTHSLTINKVGPGSGSVSCDGGACASSYPEGTTVTLGASADSGSSFTGWAGAGCSGTGNCVVTLNSDITVTAAFESNPAPPPPAAGEAQVIGGKALVKGNKALLKLACRGAGACHGVLKLFAKLPANSGKGRKGRRNHRKAKFVLIGKSPFNLAAGATKTIRVKLSGKAMKQLRRKGKLVARVRGTGVKPRSIQLRAKVARKHHKRHHRRG